MSSCTATGDGPALLHLSDADIAGLALDRRSVRLAMQDAFLQYSQGRIQTAPKTSIWLGPGYAFQSLSAVETTLGLAALKWIGMVPPGGPSGLNINATLLLSDARTGRLLCLMDARLATGLRTAGMSAVAADRLARKDSTSLGLVGAGVQAEHHLLALKELLPSLHTVLVTGRSNGVRPRIAASTAALGMTARAVAAPDALRDSDVIVTSVPIGPDFAPFLDAGLVRPGCLVIAVDMARSWRHEGLDAFDVVILDEDALRHHAKPGNFVPDLSAAHGTLADLAGARHPGRLGARERAIYVSNGSAVADLAIAALIYDRARAREIGTNLAP